MKGIAKIKGSVNPKIGEDSFYEVVEFYEGTPVPNSNDIKWKIFKKNNEKWDEAEGKIKTGMAVSFNFPPRSYGKEMLVEAYLVGPEKKSPPGLVVKPVLGSRKIVNAEILDANGGKITQTPKYGQSITLKVTTQNMPGEILKLSLWERDTIKDNEHDPKGNTKLWSGNSKIIDLKGIVEEKIMLTLAMKSDANKSWFDGSEHEYYLLVEANGMKKISATRQVSNEEAFTIPAKKPVEKPKETKPIVKQTPVKIKNSIGIDKIKPDDSNKVVKVAETEKKEEKKDKCPNCEKDITLDEIKKICVDLNEKCLIKDDAMIKVALPFLNKYRKKVGINTCTTKSHFLAQISQESKFYDLEEGFNYYWESLISTFSAFTTTEGREKAKEWGRAVKLRSSSDYKAISSVNQINIANWAYKNKNKNGSFASGDGSTYRGRGFKQITWKSNYVALSDYFNKNMKIDNEVDINWAMNPLNLSLKPKDAMVSALAFWGKNNLSAIAKDSTKESVRNVTSIINSAYKGLDERIRFFKKAVEVLKVNQCNPNKINTNYEKGTVVVVSGVSIKYGDEKNNGNSWPVYETRVYRNLSVKTYKKLKNEDNLMEADYITYLTRDAHSSYSGRSNKKYGAGNECPPGEYFLNKHSDGQKYYIYLSDTEGVGESGISGIHGWRGGIAIHGGWSSGTVGCLSTHSKNYGGPKRAKKGLPKNTLVQELISNIPDFENNNDDRSVKIILEERKATKKGSLWYGEIE